MQEAIRTAFEKFNKGDFEAATTLCRDILSMAPDHPQAFYLLGLIHHRKGDLNTGANYLRDALKKAPDDYLILYDYGVLLSNLNRFQESLTVLTKVLNLQPNFPEVHFMLGNIHFQLKQFAEAVARYQHALSLRQRYPDAWFNLGLAHKKLLKYDQAAEAFRRVLALLPDHAPGLFQLGLVLQNLGRTEEAISAFRQALALTPQNVLTCHNLGILLRDTGQSAEAIAFLEKADTLKPSHPPILNDLGLAFHEAHRFDEAVTTFRKALALKPDYPEALSNLGNTLQETYRFSEAVTCYEQAIALDPLFHEAWYNLGNYYAAMNKPDDASTMYRKAISLKSDMVEAHWNLSHTLLLKGRFEEGFREYLWRWQRKTAVRLHIPKPEWNGETLRDHTLLVHTEQGLGDTIQFVRYLPWVRERIGKLFLACETSLIDLFRSLSGIDAIFDKKELASLYPTIDCHVPLLNLPSLFTTTEAAIPTSIPYLRPDRERVAVYAPLFAEARSHFKVGLVWQGNPKHKNDANRSCRLADLEPLFSLPGTAFFSLQKKQDRNSDPLFQGVDLADHLLSFADTAAVMAHLDLVISVDTAVAHLAGALGKPVWVLLPFVPDWRWMLDREDSPWYPTMRLFRQKERLDWLPVIREMAVQLEKHVATA